MNGLLIVNLGTPEENSLEGVRVFLKEFLSDPRVIDIPFILRWLLVNQIIVPRREKESTKAYQAIWTPEGSPLAVYSRRLRDQLSAKVSDKFIVELAMRYGGSRIGKGLDRLLKEDVKDIYILPLYPQRAFATTESVLDEVHQFIKKYKPKKPIYFLQDFYSQNFYIKPYADLCRQALVNSDHLLISFHGIPLRQLKKAAFYQGPCSTTSHCCDKIGAQNAFCYRAQCLDTARRIASAAGCEDRYSVAFQSRLGSIRWTEPYIMDAVESLIHKGVKDLAVVSPSFVVDCVETLEELKIRLKKDFIAKGGRSLNVVSCLNDLPQWVDLLAKALKEFSHSSTALKFRSLNEGADSC